MAEKQNTPEIRFEGFTDPWEQRKFSDFVVASGTKNRDNLPLQSFSVSNDRGFVPQDEQFENGGTVCDADKSMYWIVEPGSFAYNPARINVGSIGYLSTSENVIVSSLYEVFRTDESCDDRFLWHWFKSPLFMKQIEMLQEGGVRLYFFFDKLLLSEIWMPSVEEQRLIGGHFDRLDDLITLHQRKYDKLCTVKKSMLDKMFPKPGETEPEIRFEGFTDPWEQRKLNEYLETSREKNESCRFDKDDVLSVSGDYGIVNQIEFQGRSYAGASVANYGVVHKGDVVYTKSPLRSNPYGIIKTNRGNDGIVSTLYAVYHPAERTHPDFVEVYFEQNARMNNYMAPLVSKGAKNDMKVSAENALKGAVIFPEIEEQEVIASYFSQLDHLITLHQRKLELLRNIKKSLLDRMFV